MTGSKEWLARYEGAVMNTFGTPQQVLVKGSGATVWDADGKAYIDLLGGIAVNVLGHAHPAILEAVTTQLATLGHVSNFFTSEPQVLLAETLLDLAGAPGRVFFTNSGAEANEAGFKATRRTGRTKLIATEGRKAGAPGMKIRMRQGQLSVTDGPFTEAKEIIGGFALMNVDSREEIVTLTKRFLDIAGDGESEIIEMFEAPAQHG